jgi:hypothetical protein
MRIIRLIPAAALVAADGGVGGSDGIEEQLQLPRGLWREDGESDRQ